GLALVRRLHLCERLHEPSLLRVARALREAARGQRLQRLPDLVQRLRFPDGRRRDDRASAGDELDQALRLQVPQRLADDRPADLEALTEVALYQPLAGLVVAQDDGVAQQLDDLLAQWRGHHLDTLHTVRASQRHACGTPHFNLLTAPNSRACILRCYLGY